jgi:hypothetical protein
VNRKEILDAAAQCILQDRNASYGEPEDSFGAIADLWSVVLRPVLKEDCRVASAQVALCMIGLKIARLIHNPTHQDSAVDIAGYAACLGSLSGETNNPPQPSGEQPC